VPRYEYSDAKSNKFWEIELEGASHTVRYGRIGTDGQAKTKEFADAAKAEADYKKMIASKVKKGYALAASSAAASSSTAPPTVASNPEMEAALIENPDDSESWAVYADWLQAQGDPRGELAAVQLALAEAPSDKALTAREAALLSEHGTLFLSPEISERLASQEKSRPSSDTKWRLDTWEYEQTKVEWHAGFFRSLRLSTGHVSKYSPHLKELAAAALGHTSARFIRELVIGTMTAEYEYEEVVAILSKSDLRCLSSLHVADFRNGDDTELSWAVLGDLSALWTAAPNLEKLIIQGGRFELGDFSLPKLRSLEIETGGLSVDSIQSLVSATWPALTKLEIYFGDENYGAGGTVEAIAPLLEGTNFPKVTDLGLMNAEFADDLCSALPKSRIAKQIERLDLSLGIMTRSGAEALAAGAGGFPKLRELTVEDNYVDEPAAAALKFAFPFVEIGDQDKLDDLEEEDDGEVWRFVSVGE